jgi:hypothetical protein
LINQIIILKKQFLAVFFQLATLGVFAQTDGTEIEQYCQIIATLRLISNKVIIDIDFVEEKDFGPIFGSEIMTGN